MVIALATLALASGWLAARAPRVAAAPRARCATFRGRRLLRAHSLSVIARAKGEQREYAYICVPPGGPVHLAGWAFDETISGQASVNVLGSAGSWVVIRFASQLDFHGGEEVAKMCNARNGRCYRFFHAFTYGGEEFQEASAEQPVLAAVLANGFGALLLAETLKGTTYVRHTSSGGSAQVLDSAPEASIPPSSLTLTGHEASWIDAGTVRRARI